MDWINYLKKLGFSESELKNMSFKYSENGIPIVNIENGVDMLKKADDTITDAFKKAKLKSEERPTYDVEEKTSNFKPISEEFREENTSKSYSGITMLTPNDFLLNNYVGKTMLGTTTSLQFECLDKNNFTLPGITDKQLAEVLLLRNKTNPDIKETLLDLLDLL